MWLAMVEVMVKEKPGVEDPQDAKTPPAANLLPALDLLIEDAIAYRDRIKADQVTTAEDIQRLTAALHDRFMRVQFRSNGISRNWLDRNGSHP